MRTLIQTACLAATSSWLTAQVEGVAAIKAGALDLAEAAAFYERYLDFDVQSGERRDGSVRLRNGEVPLILVPATKPAAGGRCRTSLNLLVDDIDAIVGTLRDGGASIGKPGASQVGEFRAVTDPSGNSLHVKKLFEPGTDRGGPGVYNLSIGVHDIELAEKFYTGALGFEVFSRKYYPPVIPLQLRGATSFILYEYPDAEPASPEPRSRISLMFETRDLAAAAARVRDAGATVLDAEPRDTADGSVVAFADPFGNVHELVEPCEPFAPDDALASLAWLRGSWTSAVDGEFREENWGGPSGDSLVGSFRWLRGGETWLYELMTIERDDRIAFRLHHFARNMKIWRTEIASGPMTLPLADISENRVVFENDTEHGPHRIVYRRIGDRLTVRLENEAGEATIFDFDTVAAR